jgi:hypothetical protein
VFGFRVTRDPFSVAFCRRLLERIVEPTVVIFDDKRFLRPPEEATKASRVITVAERYKSTRRV